MSSLLRGCAVACVAAWLTTAPAAASPITDLAPYLVGDGYVVHFGHTLNPEDLLVLATRDDNGWHLGWFKRKLRDGGGSTEVIDLGVETWTPTLPDYLAPNTLTPVTDLIGQPNEPLNTDGAPAAVVTPEPTSLILLGSGLLVVARRIQKRRAGSI